MTQSDELTILCFYSLWHNSGDSWTFPLSRIPSVRIPSWTVSDLSLPHLSVNSYHNNRRAYQFCLRLLRSLGWWLREWFLETFSGSWVICVTTWSSLFYFLLLKFHDSTQSWQLIVSYKFCLIGTLLATTFNCSYKLSINFTLYLMFFAGTVISLRFESFWHEAHTCVWLTDVIQYEQFQLNTVITISQ